MQYKIYPPTQLNYRSPRVSQQYNTPQKSIIKPEDGVLTTDRNNNRDNSINKQINNSVGNINVQPNKEPTDELRQLIQLLNVQPKYNQLLLSAIQEIKGHYNQIEQAHSENLQHYQLINQQQSDIISNFQQQLQQQKQEQDEIKQLKQQIINLQQFHQYLTNDKQQMAELLSKCQQVCFQLHNDQNSQQEVQDKKCVIVEPNSLMQASSNLSQETWETKYKSLEKHKNSEIQLKEEHYQLVIQSYEFQIQQQKQAYDSDTYQLSSIVDNKIKEIDELKIQNAKYVQIINSQSVQLQNQGDELQQIHQRQGNNQNSQQYQDLLIQVQQLQHHLSMKLQECEDLRRKLQYSQATPRQMPFDLEIVRPTLK